MRWTVLAARGLLAGLLLTASLPPFGWWILAIAGVALLADTLARCERARMRLLVGAATGVTLYGIGWWWMAEFTAPGYVLGTLIEVSILAVACLVVGRGRVWAVVCALVLAEYIRGHFPFGGVPLAGLPLGQIGGPLGQSARLGGQLFLVALLGAAGVGVAYAFRRRWAHAAVAVAVVVAGAVGGHLVDGTHADGSLRVAAVQGGGRRGFRAIYGDPTQAFLAQVRVTQQVQTPVDLVVWPEDVIDVDQIEGSRESDIVGTIAQRLNTTLVAGIVEDSGPEHFANAALAWGPDGTVVDRYDKVHRVPYGEYIPFRGLVEHLANIDAVPRDARKGHGDSVLHTPAGKLGVSISYEVFFPDRSRIAVRHGATVLLVPTNAASFSTGQVPAQELAAARLRAVEAGRWVVQAAPTGYTAVIDDRGKVHSHTDLGEPATIERRVTHRRGLTPSVRLGEAPLVLAALLGGLAAAFAPRRRPDEDEEPASAPNLSA